MTFYLNDGSQGEKIIEKTDVTQPLFFLSQSHCVGFSLHFLTRGASWDARLRTGMSCQVFDSSWGRKWELQKMRRRRRKIQLWVIYKSSVNISLKFGILAPFWLITSLDLRILISSLLRWFSNVWGHFRHWRFCEQQPVGSLVLGYFSLAITLACTGCGKCAWWKLYSKEEEQFIKFLLKWCI